MIRAVAVDIGSARKAIPNVAKVFSFIGDGTALEVLRMKKFAVIVVSCENICPLYL